MDDLNLNGELGPVPEPDWTPDQLGEFVQLAGRTKTILAHRIGIALNLAKAKLEHGKWEAWVKQYCADLAPATIRRYMRLAKAYTEEQLGGVTLSEAYAAMAQTRGKAGKKAEEPQQRQEDEQDDEEPNSSAKSEPDCAQPARVEDGDQEAAVVITRRSPPKKVPVHRGEIEDGFHDLSDVEDEPDLEDYDGEPDPAQKVRDVIKDVVPYRLGRLSEDIAWLRGQEADVRQAAWRKVDRDQVAKQVRTLRGDLEWLATDLAV